MLTYGFISMARYHEGQKNWVEVAMCIMHAAAIVSEHVFDPASGELAVSGKLNVWYQVLDDYFFQAAAMYLRAFP